MIVVKEPLTTVIFLIFTVALIILHIALFMKKPKKKSNVFKWLNKVFEYASEYYCIEVKPEGDGYRLSVFYDEFSGKKYAEYFIRTKKSADEVCTDIINQMQKYINNGRYRQILMNALKIELCCEEEIFIIKEDAKWKEEAEY